MRVILNLIAWAIIIFLIILIAIYIWYNPELIFSPVNYLYRKDSSLRTNFYTEQDKNSIFPVSNLLESKWKQIRDEGYSLYESLPNKNINYLDNYNINLGEENKKDWTTIPLRLFGSDSPEYINKCPILGDIVKEHSEIKSCLYSIMQPGKIIKPHVGPYDGLIRYQLALDVPGNTSVTDNMDHGAVLNECYLYVGDEKYYWKEGKGILFDESYLHGAVNTTSKTRMVLLIDIERPYNFFVYRILNKVFIKLLGLLS